MIKAKKNLSSTEVLLFFLVYFSYLFFYQAGGFNENARFDQIRALVEHGELHINRYSVNTGDVIDISGIVYPSKAPGTTFVGAPLWFVIAKALKILDLEKQAEEQLLPYLVTIFSISLLSAFTSVFFFRASLFLGLEKKSSILLTILLFLGTIIFPFSTLFFSHVFSFCFLFLAFYLLLDIKQENLKKNSSLSGVLLGFSVCFEYPALIAAFFIGLYFLSFSKNRKVLHYFIFGGILGLLPCLLYHYFAFGDPFYLPYMRYAEVAHSDYPAHKEGLLGIKLPSLDILYKITLDPQRGIFFISPILFLCFFSLTFFIFRKEQRTKENALFFVIFVSYLLFNAGYGDSITYWGGGASTGPRHVIPALPFILLSFIPLFRIKIFRVFIILLGFYSIFSMLLFTAIEPKVAYEYSNPLSTYFFHYYLKSWYPINETGVFTMKPIFGRVAAFNLGAALGLPAKYSLLPLFVFWILGFSLLLKNRVGFLFSFITVVFFSLPFLSQSAFYDNDLRSERFLSGSYQRGLPPRNLLNKASSYAFFTSAPIYKNIDRQIDFSWRKYGPPLPAPFIAEWEREIKIEKEGNYEFYLESDDGSALYLDDVLLLSNWKEQRASGISSWIFLKKNSYKIKIRYFNNLGGAHLRAAYRENGKEFKAL